MATMVRVGSEDLPNGTVISSPQEPCNSLAAANEIVLEVQQPTENEKKMFEIGKGFNSYDEINAAILEYEKRYNVKLYVRDSRKIDVNSYCRRRKNPVPPVLKYGEIHYRCRHGGKLHMSRSKGLRPNQRWVGGCLCRRHELSWLWYIRPYQIAQDPFNVQTTLLPFQPQSQVIPSP